MLAVTGLGSTIVKELRGLLPPDEEVIRIADRVWPPVADRYFLCAGVLRPKMLHEQSAEEIAETLNVNCMQPIMLCDEILRCHKAARIVVMGSQSGITWSYDGAYAAAKAALHRYVETKKLGPHQQLVCVAPSIIEDTGMTRARTDHENLARRTREHPKQRLLKAVEVARLVHFLLYVDQGYISGTVIRVDGGC